MTIDIVELHGLLTELIDDSTVDSKYQSRLKRLRASIDPSGRFNLRPTYEPDDGPLTDKQIEDIKQASGVDQTPTKKSNPLLNGANGMSAEDWIEWDPVDRIDLLDEVGSGVYVGLRDGHLRTDPGVTVDYKRPADTEGGHAD